MAGKKSSFPKFKYYVPDDLNKKGFVYWYEDGKRIRLYGDINQYQTIPRRR